MEQEDTGRKAWGTSEDGQFPWIEGEGVSDHDFGTPTDLRRRRRDKAHTKKHRQRMEGVVCGGVAWAEACWNKKAARRRVERRKRLPLPREAAMD